MDIYSEKDFKNKLDIYGKNMFLPLRLALIGIILFKLNIIN